MHAACQPRRALPAGAGAHVPGSVWAYLHACVHACAQTDFMKLELNVNAACGQSVKSVTVNGKGGFPAPTVDRCGSEPAPAPLHGIRHAPLHGIRHACLEITSLGTVAA